MAVEAADTPPIPKPPRGLKSAGRRFWREIHSAYSFDGQPEASMLVEQAARTADLVDRLQEIVDGSESLRARGSRGQDVAIPELDALKAYRAQFAALIKQLDLPNPVDDEEDMNPDVPMSRSESGKVAAAARWAGRFGL